MTKDNSSALLTVPGGSQTPRSLSPDLPVYTPPPSESSAISNETPPKRRPSPLSISSQGRVPLLPVSGDIRFTGSQAGENFDSDEEIEMERPPLHRPTGGLSETPLLKDERGRPSYESPAGSARPAFVSRRSTFRSRSPDFDAQSATKKKYIYAAFFLGLSLVSFVVQTETATWVSQRLGWKKPYCML